MPPLPSPWSPTTVCFRFFYYFVNLCLFFLERTGGVADTLGSLSVGEVVAIFLAVFVFGIIIGILLGVFLGRTTFAHKHLNKVLKRRKGKSV